MQREQVIHALVESFSRLPRSGVENIRKQTKLLGVCCGERAGMFYDMEDDSG